jgi:hypothetical protein
MTREQLTPNAKTIVRAAPILGLGLVVVAAALASKWHSHHPRTPHRARAPFSVAARPTTRSVIAGHTVRYRISFVRHGYMGWIKLTVAKPPRATSAYSSAYPSPRAPGKLGLKTYGHHMILTVSSRFVDRPGRYLIRLMARGGRYHSHLTLGLRIVAPKPAPFTISGSTGQLWPGVSRTVNLSVSNPNGHSISVQRLVLSIRRVVAPRATPALPCSAADFSVTQFSGSYPLLLPAHATRRLSGLGVTAFGQPRVTMLDRPVNQDGCQGAKITLGYTGKATGP